jgi:hypothetical protein
LQNGYFFFPVVELHYLLIKKGYDISPVIATIVAVTMVAVMQRYYISVILPILFFLCYFSSIYVDEYRIGTS